MYGVSKINYTTKMINDLVTKNTNYRVCLCQYKCPVGSGILGHAHKTFRFLLPRLLWWWVGGSGQKKKKKKKNENFLCSSLLLHIKSHV